MAQDVFVIGVDYGSDSVRSVVVNAQNGQEVASSVFYYPRWREGAYCDPTQNQFRQHPLDYIEGLEFTIKECLQKAGAAVAENVKGISVDTTGSTPVAVNQQGTPLALLPEFAENPNAMFVLWKDHTGVQEAAEINAHAATFKPNYLQFVGGIYSSEWFWAKLLHVLRADAQVREATYSWVEHCDWIPFLLTGGTQVEAMKRGVCSAGHKSLWAAEFGGLPPNEFFSSLDPVLNGFTSRLFQETYTADQAAGQLSPEWAKRLGLSTQVVVGVGAFDAHMGAVGGQIEPYHLSKVMGTSTCDMLVTPLEEIGDTLVNGICGQVPGSVIPGMMGLEAGQSAFGDTYAWFKKILLWPLQNLLANSKVIDAATAQALVEEVSARIIPELSLAADQIPLSENNEFGIDWFNGRRTPDANQVLKGALSGLSLGSDAPRVFRALVEATCFGAKKIVDRFNEQGVPVKGLIGLGGVARKSPFIMQMMADVMNMPIRIHKSEQTCALGAAMFAATAAGLYARVEDAMAAMGQGFDLEYFPNPEKVDLYAKRYQHYTELGGFLDRHSTAGNPASLADLPEVSSPAQDGQTRSSTSPQALQGISQTTAR
ncbi:ribulokinase [Rufibacter glacialis]|uniref:Ribulokinase n=1 Tax=Rufibacter glacialis TaxID=1259555 RepID=A0A5M8QQ88_9BACT|nr:ribulokinase [Rufibacter glacialis]KAA6437164.1 ribulokinase [Rufibacter glacialis]GGK61649.1 ribulokinase [Rufibacter glacialis]